MRLAIPAMPTTKPASKQLPKTAKSAVVVADPRSLKEANRLIEEGCHVRYASVQRRLQLQGPLDFSSAPKSVPNITSFKELLPKYLKKVPTGWEVAAEGFVCRLTRDDAPAVAKLINARRDELGVYSCEKDAQGWRLVFEF